MRPLRVVHLVGNNLPVASFRLFARLANPERVSLVIGSLDGEGPLQRGLQETGIKTFALGAANRARYPAAMVAFARLLRNEHADVLQTHLLDACIVGLAAGRIARVPVTVFTAHHSHEIPLHSRRLLTLADTLAAGPLCDHVIAPSTPMKDTLVRVHRIAPDKIRVIPHGFDFTYFDPTTTNGDTFRAAHGVGNSIVFGAVSRYFWIKNVDGLIRAFAQVSAREPAAKLVVVGDGDRSDAERLVGQLDLQGKVILLGPVKTVAEAYAGFDVFVHPSLAESFGQAIVEAMAMAKPVVSTPVGIAPEVIDEGLTGFIAEGSQPDAIAAAMVRSLESRSRWDAIGSAARRRAAEYAAERWVQQHEAAYENWISTARRGKWRRG